MLKRIGFLQQAVSDDLRVKLELLLQGSVDQRARIKMHQPIPVTPLTNEKTI